MRVLHQLIPSLNSRNYTREEAIEILYASFTPNPSQISHNCAKRNFKDTTPSPSSTTQNSKNPELPSEHIGIWSGFVVEKEGRS